MAKGESTVTIARSDPRWRDLATCTMLTGIAAVAE
jgi:hypothetical protein